MKSRMFILLFWLSLSGSGCTSLDLVVNRADLLSVRPSSLSGPSFELDSRKGGKGAFSVSLPALVSNSYATQVAKTVADFKSFKLYLVYNASGALTTAEGPFTVNKTTITASGDSQIVNFSQVPAGDYYVAAAGFDGVNGTGANITNLASGATLGTEHYYVSNGGGDTPGYPGRVSINSSFVVTGPTQLTLTLTLLDD